MRALEIYRAVISLATREGAETEIFLLKRDLKSIRASKNEIVEAQNIVEEGAGIRVIKDGSMGFSATNNLEDSSLEKAFRSALRMAKVSRRNPKWSGLPRKMDNIGEQIPLQSYDAELASKSLEEITELVLRMLKQIDAGNQTNYTLTCALMVLTEEFSILNSHGFEHFSEPSTLLFSRTITDASEGAKYSTATKQFCSHKLSEFIPEKEVFETSRSATDRLSLPQKRIPKSSCDIILSPESVGAFAAYLLTPMIIGRSVEQGVSCFTNMLNTKVSADSFSLRDDGHLKGGIGSATIDDEGTPTRETKIVERGTLRGFLYDTLSACWSDTSSTGNARRASDALGRTYLAPPEPTPTNLVVESGDFSPEELVEETKHGVLIDSINYTFHLVPERGYFNMTSNFPSLIIENGEIEACTQNISISDELCKTLMKIGGIGKNVGQFAFLGSIMTSVPHLKINNMPISYAS